jgi:hypothetical protein
VNKIREDSIACWDLSIINLGGSEINDSGWEFIHVKNGGIIKINSSKMKQSNKTIPISKIENHGKIFLINVRIELNGAFDPLSTFANANFVQLRNVILNDNRIADYLFEKQ